MQLPLLRVVIVASLAVSGLVGMTATAGAHDTPQRGAKLVHIQDDCDPQTFNAALGPGACVGDGGTTFEELVSELMDRREAGAWRFSPEEFAVRQGTRLRALNQGGEVHSFTKVRRFGPGCVPEVNEILGFPEGAMVRECRSPAWLATLRPPGRALRVRGLQEGTHRYECLIHPWMRTTVRVREAQR